MSKRRKVIGLVLLLLIIAAAIGGGALLTLAPFSTASIFERYGDRDVAPFWNAQGFHQFKTELLDADQYVASFDPDGSSEQIIADYEVCKDGLSFWVIYPAPSGDPFAGAHWRYDVRLNGQLIDQVTRTHSGPAQGSCPNTWIGAEHAVMQLYGNDKTGKLEVESYAYMCDLIPFIGCSGSSGWVKYGYDAARMVSGVGSCAVVTAMPVKPGADIQASCNLGWATGKTGTGGWSLWLGDPSGPATRLATMPNNAFDYIVNFKAPAERGIYNIHLLNGLFQVDWFQFTVTVNPELAPPPPTWSVTPNPPYKPGDSVTLSWSAVPNSATNVPIKQVWVEIAYTDGTTIKPRVAYVGATGSVTFTVSKTIDIHASLVAEDNNGELSGPEQRTLQVEKCDVNNRCQPPPGGGLNIPIWLIVVLIAAAFILLAVLVPFIPLFPWKLILMLIAGILILVAVIVFPR